MRSPAWLFLRRRLRQHHRSVLGYAMLTAAGAILLWLAAYGLAWWLLLFFRAATLGAEAHPPAHYTSGFIVLGALGLLIARLLQWLNPDDRPPDHKGALAIFVDFLLVVPRVTLAIWGNLSAWQRLTPSELEHAALLLERLATDRMLLRSLPQVIPGDEPLERLVFALQILELAKITREDSEYWLEGTSAKSALTALAKGRTTDAQRDTNTAN